MINNFIFDAVSRFITRLLLIFSLSAICFFWPQPARATVYLQYFETKWEEIRANLPTIFAVGYGGIWLPPASKGCAGRNDIGFSPYDRFDLGDVNQRGTTETRYGSRQELLKLTKEIHRLGGKVFLDLVLNHNGNPARLDNAPGKLEPVAMDQYPHLHPLDFHLLPANTDDDGRTYQALLPAELGKNTKVIWAQPKWKEHIVPALEMSEENGQIENYTHWVRAPWDDFSAKYFDWNWSLRGQLDLANEQQLLPDRSAADPKRDGINNVTQLPLPIFVRQPKCSACYPNGEPYEEDVRQYLLRYVWWLGNLTDADGFRISSARHIPHSFFTADFPNDPIALIKQIQYQYQLRRGKKDHNDVTVVGEVKSDDLLGTIDLYLKTGMKLLNYPLFTNLLDLLGSDRKGRGDMVRLSYPRGGFSGADKEFGGLGRHNSINFVQSYDMTGPDLMEDLAMAFTLTRPGDAVIFFDGHHRDGQSWVKPGRADALGDFDSTLSKLIFIHNHYAQGGMFNRFIDDDAFIYERVLEGQGPTLLMVLHDNIGPDDRCDKRGVAKFGEDELRPLAITGFAPGTKLVDLTGNSPIKNTVVLDPQKVSAKALAAAKEKYKIATGDAPLPTPFGLVNLAVNSGPHKNFAAYAVAPPAALKGQSPIEINPATETKLQVSEEKQLANGQNIDAKYLTAYEVSGKRISIRVHLSPAADGAYLQIDGGQTNQEQNKSSESSPSRKAKTKSSLDAGRPASDSQVQPVARMPIDQLSEGHLPLMLVEGEGAKRVFEYKELDISKLRAGTHLLKVKIVDTDLSRPPVFNTLVFPLIVKK